LKPFSYDPSLRCSLLFFPMEQPVKVVIGSGALGSSVASKQVRLGDWLRIKNDMFFRDSPVGAGVGGLLNFSFLAVCLAALSPFFFLCSEVFVRVRDS